MTEDEMVGWHHRLDGHEFEQAPGDGDEQGSPACCSPWGRKESDMTERLHWLVHWCDRRVCLCAYVCCPCVSACAHAQAGGNTHVLSCFGFTKPLTPS